MKQKFKIHSYDRDRDLKIGDSIKDGEQVLCYFEDEEGRKMPTVTHHVSAIVDKDYNIIRDHYLGE